MTEVDFDAQFTRVMIGLLQVRRTLAPGDLDALLRSMMAEIQSGLDLAEEQTLENSFRRKDGNVTCLRFPSSRHSERSRPA